jgi:hypothetical protein
MKTFLLACILVVVQSRVVSAQDILQANLKWTSSSTTNLKNNEQFSYNCFFKTTGSQTIRWFQKNGTVETTFSIVSTTGSWSNILGNGSISFSVTRDGSAGSIVFSRADNYITVTLDFGEQGIQQRFVIETIQPLIN